MKNQKQPAVAVSALKTFIESIKPFTAERLSSLIKQAEADFEKNKLKEPQEYTFDEFCALKPKQRKRSNMLIHSRIILETDGSAKNLQYWLSDFGKWHKSLDFTALKDLQYRIDPDYKAEAEPKPVEKPEPSYAERQAAWVKENDVKIGDKVKVLRKAEDYEQGWNYDWADKMDALIGEIVEITGEYIDAEDTNGFLVTGDWYMPYFVLEKVPEPQYRPFTLEELPFDSPVRLKTQPKSKRRISFADEKGVYIYILSGDKLTYEQALEELEFADECEDRTFGVRL